ncbi:hypothetical protein GCK72_021488 [Caenorhabditis remanei]|uniref:Uncharacterized protein n=1 Tax=Caenorhabditis remanei TaxID=31234 RepID=A0A6A5GJS0_CAERE|nr:hypothetical protein GCK72_021488 [Caenorhabditis remanei]KAF1754923.1 hypothetical protein GCK72_021488 [Caenorhabditis remanei]
MGYAPRKRNNLLVEKIVIKPIKKPFPIDNWFIAVITIYEVFCITTIVFVVIDDYQKVDGLSGSDIDNVGVCLAYLFSNAGISALLTAFFCFRLPQNHFKIGFYYTILQWFPLTVCIFIFNQQLFCGSKADLLKRKFIFSFHAQFFTIPLLIINTYISALAFLIISKLRPEYDGDDLYEVIYGGEGSSTKKIDV